MQNKLKGLGSPCLHDIHNYYKTNISKPFLSFWKMLPLSFFLFPYIATSAVWLHVHNPVLKRTCVFFFLLEA